MDEKQFLKKSKLSKTYIICGLFLIIILIIFVPWIHRKGSEHYIGIVALIIILISGLGIIFISTRRRVSVDSKGNIMVPVIPNFLSLTTFTPNKYYLDQNTYFSRGLFVFNFTKNNVKRAYLVRDPIEKKNTLADAKASNKRSLSIKKIEAILMNQKYIEASQVYTPLIQTPSKIICVEFVKPLNFIGWQYPVSLDYPEISKIYFTSAGAEEIVNYMNKK